MIDIARAEAIRIEQMIEVGERLVDYTRKGCPYLPCPVCQ